MAWHVEPAGNYALLAEPAIALGLLHQLRAPDHHVSGMIVNIRDYRVSSLSTFFKVTQSRRSIWLPAMGSDLTEPDFVMSAPWLTDCVR